MNGLIRHQRAGRAPSLLALLLCVFRIASAEPDSMERGDRRAFADGLYSRGMHALAAHEYEMLLRDIPDMPERDVVLYRLGESLRESGKATEAREAFKQVLAEYPESPFRLRAGFKLGALYADSGEHVEAVVALKRVLAKATDADLRASTLYYLAESLAQVAYVSEAIDALLKLRKEFPASEYTPYAALKLGRLYADQAGDGGREPALKAYRDAELGAPDARLKAEAAFQTAQLYFDTGDFKASAEAFQRLLREYPEDMRAEESGRQAAWAMHNAGLYADALEIATRETAREGALKGRDEWLYLKANCERQLMQPKAATATYATLLATHGQSPYAAAARYEKALTHFKQGEYDAAVADAVRVVDEAKLRRDTLWLLAESEAAAQRAERAVQYYRLLVTEFPESRMAADSLYRLAYHLQQREAWAEASRYYLQLVEGFPEGELAPRALFASGVCLSRDGQGALALRDWDQLIKQYPAHESIPEALYQKAMEALRQKQQESAMSALTALLKQFPKTLHRADALFWQGQLYHAKGELTEAEKALRAALAAGPTKETERQAGFVLGLTLQQAGRDDEAAALFLPLLEAPDRSRFSAERLAWLAEFQFAKGNAKDSERAARALLEAAPEAQWQQTGWALVGRACRALDKRKEAIEAYRKAAEMQAQTRFGAEAALRVGELLVDEGQVQEGQVWLQRAATLAGVPELQGIRALAYVGLGKAAEAQGDLAEATRFYMSVAILFNDPKVVPEALARAATLLAQQGRGEESRAAVRELLDRYPESDAARTWQGSAAAGGTP